MDRHKVKIATKIFLVKFLILYMNPEEEKCSFFYEK